MRCSAIRMLVLFVALTIQVEPPALPRAAVEPPNKPVADVASRRPPTRRPATPVKMFVETSDCSRERRRLWGVGKGWIVRKLAICNSGDQGWPESKVTLKTKTIGRL